jgi:hypothetical protein
MPLLHPSASLSVTHRRANRFALIGLSIIGLLLGVWQAKYCAEIRFGYVAGYSYATAVFLAIALCGIGLLLIIYWRTRGLGTGLILAGILSCATFYGSMALLMRLDLVAWRHEPPQVSVGPRERASLVIYFKHGTSDAQVENFRSYVLADREGRYPPFVRIYLRLMPSKANGHEGVALTFSEGTRSEEITSYVEKIERDHRVDSLHRDIAPTAIEKPSKAK